jgi:hypothetical protein
VQPTTCSAALLSSHHAGGQVPVDESPQFYLLIMYLLAGAVPFDHVYLLTMYLLTMQVVKYLLMSSPELAEACEGLLRMSPENGQ